MKQFNVKDLEADIMREAKILKVPEGSAKAIAENVVERVEKWIKSRPAVTLSDIDRRVAKEIAKYNTDLAYVYQNRGKII